MSVAHSNPPSQHKGNMLVTNPSDRPRGAPHQELPTTILGVLKRSSLPIICTLAAHVDSLRAPVYDSQCPPELISPACVKSKCGCEVLGARSSSTRACFLAKTGLRVKGPGSSCIRFRVWTWPRVKGPKKVVKTMHQHEKCQKKNRPGWEH